MARTIEIHEIIETDGERSLEKGYEFSTEASVSNVDKGYWVEESGEIVYEIIPSTELVFSNPPGWDKYVDYYNIFDHNLGVDPHPAWGPADEFARDEQFMWDIKRRYDREIGLRVLNSDGSVAVEGGAGFDKHIPVSVKRPAAAEYRVYFTNEPVALA